MDWCSPNEFHVIPGNLRIRITDNNDFKVQPYLSDLLSPNEDWEQHCRRRPGYNLYVDWYALLSPSPTRLRVEEKLKHRLDLVYWWPAKLTAPLSVAFGCQLFGKLWDSVPKHIRALLLTLRETLAAEHLPHITDFDIGLSEYLKYADDCGRKFHKEATPVINLWLDSLGCPPCLSAILMRPPLFGETSFDEVCLAWDMRQMHSVKKDAFLFCRSIGYYTIAFESEGNC